MPLIRKLAFSLMPHLKSRKLTGPPRALDRAKTISDLINGFWLNEPHKEEMVVSHHCEKYLAKLLLLCAELRYFRHPRTPINTSACSFESYENQMQHALAGYQDNEKLKRSSSLTGH